MSKDYTRLKILPLRIGTQGFVILRLHVELIWIEKQITKYQKCTLIIGHDK